MILYNCFHTDEENHEKVPFTSPGFPCICVHSELARYPDACVAWHWHSSCETVFVLSGSIEMRTPEQTLLLRRGDAGFVNSGVLHSYRSVGEEPAVQIAQLFHTEFLSGAYGSLFEEKYVFPVTRCKTLPCFAVRPDSRARLRMIADLMDAAEQMRQEPDGFEFAVRSLLSEFWYGLFAETRELRAAAPARNSQDTERIKRMMDFIEEHYGEALSVGQIGASAGVGERECNRCFQRSIGATPIRHLTDVRVRKAAEMLANSPATVLSVSEACGFSSSAYFGKVFREAMGCTPKAYQKKQRMAVK